MFKEQIAITILPIVMTIHLIGIIYTIRLTYNYFRSL